MDVKNGGTFRGRLNLEMNGQIVSPCHSLSITIDCGLTTIASLESEGFTRAFHNRAYSFNFVITWADVENGVPYELLRRALNREEFDLTFRPDPTTEATSGYASKYNILTRCAASSITMDNMDDNNNVMRITIAGDSLGFGFDNFRTDLKGNLV